ncbi:MAG: LuxR C-terminal-related transcriptional regulator [Gordonibacter sp.]|uniref:response regulator transcription factor n=1 Tax=Gordonibacter sp. TaxID=1968902 RepID=UPI002FC93A1C
MRYGNIIACLKESSLALLTVLGFASFKVAQSTFYATAGFTTDGSFILISGIEFSILSALMVLATEAIVVYAVFSRLLRAFSLPVIVPTAVFLAVAVFSFSGALAKLPSQAALLAVAMVHGCATVMLTLAWVELLSRLGPSDAAKTLAASMLLASAISLALQGGAAPVKFAATAVFLVTSAVLCCMERGRLAIEVPKRTSASPRHRLEKAPPSFRKHLQGLVFIGEGLVSLLVLGCAVGIINGFMFREGAGFDGSSEASSLGTCLASIVFFVAVFSLPKVFSASKAYRMLFPLLTGILIAWPLVDFQYGYFFSAAFVTGHAFVATSVMCLIISEGSRRSLNPYAFMGMSVFLIRLSSMAGLFLGTSLAAIDAATSFKNMLVIVVVIYLLSLVLLYMLRKRSREIPVETPPVSHDEAFQRRAAELASRYRLTQRESDILEHLSRGRTATYIGATLYLSPNTVRGYIKNIYAKMEVHSKQELIDLFT